MVERSHPQALARPRKGDSDQIRHGSEALVYTVGVRETQNGNPGFYVNYDYGVDRRVDRGSNQFQGIAGAARFQVTKQLAFAPRLEFYKDRDGFITGTAQNLKEATLTGEWKLMDGFLMRLEYRRDWSNQKYFDRGNDPASSRTQSTILIGFIGYFGPKK